MLLRDNIYDAIKADILTCRLAPGEEMREQEMAARYEVSRAPVREALLRLERERLVTVHARRGYSVNPVSVADARELLQLRIVLESACASEAAENGLPDILQNLNRFRCFERDEDFIEYNRMFHAAIAEATGNRRMAAMTMDVVDQCERLVRVSLNSIKGRDPGQLVTEHGEIIDALQQRDGRRAARLVRDHISKAERRVLSALARSAIVS
jgi:DNA-binding GntR family transcriptional regulator